ncbi:MAG TPA: hypothetical protein VF457_12750 [Burkholderiaceae bacterium]
MSRYFAARMGALAVAAALGGCATIVGSPTQVIPVASTPSDASIRVVDEAGVEIFKGTTPTTMTLPKSTGHYWGKKSYTVTISKNGYQTRTIPITASPNGWYLAGNLVFGGLIGYFVVDPFSGNMYTLSPGAVDASLDTATARRDTATDGRIAVVLLQDVPPALRGQLTRVR